MRKKVIVTVGFLLFVVMMWSMVGCSLGVNTSRAEPTQAFKLEFEPKGTSTIINEIDSEHCFVYKFDSPNDGIVVYKLYNQFYIVGEECIGKDEIISYGNIINSDTQFMGLSDNYLLFLEEDGITAVSFPFDEGHNAVYDFDELSDEAQAAFIYPVSYERYE